MLTDIDRTLASVVDSIQIQRPNTVSAKAPLLAAYITKQPFEPQIQYLPILITETSSTSTPSHHFATVKIPINKNLRQTKIWVGAPDLKANADMDVAILTSSTVISFPSYL